MFLQINSKCYVLNVEAVEVYINLFLMIIFIIVIS